MAQVTFTNRANIIAGQPENVNDVLACIDQLQAGVNNVEADQIVDGTITPVELAAGAVTAAKLATDAKIVTGSSMLASDYVPGGSYADVTGVTASFTPTVASTLIAIGVFGSQLSSGVTTASATLENYVYFDLDGSQSGLTGQHIEALAITGGNTGLIQSRSNIVILTVAPVTAAPHTLKVRAKGGATIGANALKAKPDGTLQGSGFYYFLLPS